MKRFDLVAKKYLRGLARLVCWADESAAFRGRLAKLYIELERQNRVPLKIVSYPGRYIVLDNTLYIRGIKIRNYDRRKGYAT